MFSRNVSHRESADGLRVFWPHGSSLSGYNDREESEDENSRTKCRGVASIRPEEERAGKFYCVESGDMMQYDANM